MRLLTRHLILLFAAATVVTSPAAAAEKPPLIAAVKADDAAAVRALANPANINISEPDGTTALAWAVYLGKTEFATLLVTNGADLNKANGYGVTPLSIACENANAPMVALLLKAGADPNKARLTGETPLMTCISARSAAAVSALITAGADSNLVEHREGQSALMWASATRQPAVVQALLACGADVHLRSKLLPVPEPFIVERKVNFYGRNFPPTTRFRKTTGGFTALLFAVQQGDIDTTKALLTGGAKIDDGTDEDGSALVIAIASGHQDLALWLIDQGANPNAHDGNGITALHYSLHMGLQNLAGMREAPSDRFGWIRPNLPVVMKALLAKGADLNARVQHCWPFVVNDFIGRTTDETHQVDMTGATPFLLAAASGDAASMRILKEAGADVNATNIEGVNAVVLAAGLGTELKKGNEQRYLEAARVAVEYGVDINGKHQQDGRTALHAAVVQGWTEMIRFLVKAGVKIDAKDMWGQTPLTIAMGDPEDVLYRPYPGGNKEDRFRIPKPQPKIAELLLSLGHPPFTGKYKDKSGR
ncbi:MAG: ankyrin repeat domain-containing protein [Vicinamibacterales bacterium]